MVEGLPCWLPQLSKLVTTISETSKMCQSPVLEPSSAGDMSCEHIQQVIIENIRLVSKGS